MRAHPLLSFLVLFLLGLGGPLATTGGLAQTGGADDPGLLTLDDPAGDVTFWGVDPPGGVENPATPALQNIDILSLTIGPETPSELSFAIDVAGWDPVLNRAVQAGALNGWFCSIGWTYGGSDLDYSYGLTIYSGGIDVPAEDPEFRSELYFDGPDWNWDYTFDGHETTWDAEATTLNVRVQKEFVPVFPGARPPALGDSLQLSWTYCRTDTGLAFSHIDRLADVETEGRYAFRSPGAGDVVRVTQGLSYDNVGMSAMEFGFPEGGGKAISVAAGQKALVPIQLENLEPEKKLVLLSADADGDDGAAWNLSIAPSIFLRAGEQRTVYLIVTPPASAEPGATVDAQVQADVAAEDAVGVAGFRLKVAPQLGDEHDKIHLHAKSRPASFGPAWNEVSARYDLMVSLLPDEPGWDQPVMDPGALSGSRLATALDPLGVPVRLAGDDEATFQVTIAGDEQGLHDVSLHLTAEPHGTLYSFQGDLPTGTHTVALPSYFDGDVVLEAGTELVLRLDQWRSRTASKSGIDPAGTFLQLPVRSDGVGLDLTDGMFLPNLGLGVGEDKVAYLNPGKEYAFDLVLANDGVETDDLRVTATTNASGWRLAVLPGSLFRIDAGASTPFGVSVIAPEGAKEGETAVIEVMARSKHDGLASASMTLQAIATDGVEIEEKTYGEREDQIKPLEESRESPVGLLLPLALLGAGLAAARRRHDHS